MELLKAGKYITTLKCLDSIVSKVLADPDISASTKSAFRREWEASYKGCAFECDAEILAWMAEVAPKASEIRPKGKAKGKAKSKSSATTP